MAWDLVTGWRADRCTDLERLTGIHQTSFFPCKWDWLRLAGPKMLNRRVKLNPAETLRRPSAPKPTTSLWIGVKTRWLRCIGWLCTVHHVRLFSMKVSPASGVWAVGMVFELFNSEQDSEPSVLHSIAYKWYNAHLVQVCNCGGPSCLLCSFTSK